MEVHEVFKLLAEHMLKGTMLHQELANYYDFLGLSGYKRCHEYHFLKEMLDYRKLQRYYINHFNKLIPESVPKPEEVIPSTWFSVERGQVDAATRQAAIKSGLEKWVKWQRDTKKYYQDMYAALMDENQVAAALFIQELIEDVSCELKKAQRYWLNKKAISYSMDVIISEQKEYHEKYKKNMIELLD